MNPLVSIIVPVYNVELYLRQCLDSIVNQTYKNLEIILVDDGSTDNSGLICDEYASKDKRIKVIHKENGGLSSARNAGMEYICGDYFYFVDSDDYLCEDAILFLIKYANGKNIVVGNLVIFDFNTGNEHFLCFPNINQVKPEHYFNLLEDNNNVGYVVAWNKLYPTKLCKSIRFPLGKIHEDVYTTHLFVGACKNVTLINKKTYTYVLRTGSITNNKSNFFRNKLFEFNGFMERRDYYLKNNYFLPISKNENTLYMYYSEYIFKKSKLYKNCTVLYKKTKKRYRRIFFSIKSNKGLSGFLRFYFHDFYVWFQGKKVHKK